MLEIPLISVCIAHYKGIALIDACITSVRDQVCAADIEILVHDDVSTDGSVEHLRRYHPDVVLIVSKQNVGFCIANNRLAANAHGDYLLLLNNDAMLFPDALATLLQEAQRLGRPALLTLPQYEGESGRLLDIGCLLDPFLNPVPNLDPQRGDVATVHGACLWLDRPLWDEVGGFPEWFGSVAEDLYLCCRVRLAGHPVRALGVSGYRHHVGQSFGGGKVTTGRLASTFRRRALSERNKTFVMALTCPAPMLWLLLPIHLLSLLVEGTLLSLLKRDARFLRLIYLPALHDLLYERRRLVGYRRAVMSRRRLASVDFFSTFVWLPQKLRMLWRHGIPRLR